MKIGFIGCGNMATAMLKGILKSGEVAATIYVDSKAEIEKAFEMLEDLKAGKKVDAEYKVPSVLVTKENVKEYMK